jgi:hypothetical protein
MLETGEIKGFPMVRDYASYCRCVGSQKLSNGNKKDELILRKKKNNFFSAGRSVLT